MIDLGLVTILPWTNLYPLFSEKPKGFDGDGGYKIADNKCFVLMNGNGQNISLPTPKQEIQLSIIVNAEPQIISFNGNINLKEVSNIVIQCTYEIMEGR